MRKSLLKENIHLLTWVSMSIALIGVTVMVMDNLEAGSVLAVIGGCIVSGAILLDSVGARYKREVAKI